MSNCNCHTSATGDGSGRLLRYLTALDPAYAKIDGRSREELLVFVKKYAAQIRFYDIPGSTGEETPEDITQLSWREFFRRDLAVTAASIMQMDVTAFKTEYEENRAELEMAPTPHHFGNLFDPILGMAAKLDGWLSLAIPGHPLHEDLHRIILSGLKPAMKKILSYEEAFRLVDARHPLKLNYTPIQNDDLWGLNDEIIPDATIYTGASIEAKMLSAMLYVDDLFNTFYGILSELVNDAEKYMEYAMEKYPMHHPHMALFLTFLQLFSIAQEQMNGITGRMLDFYYRDVLHLEEKPSIPDRVHVIFELAKDIVQYDIAKATSLNGGKDSAGKDQVYTTNTDLVVNQAKVKELKTIFIQKGEVGDAATRSMVPSVNAVYARPIAKSADGFGEKITDPGGKWYTFGQGTPGTESKLDTKNPCTFIDQVKQLANRKDQAQVGFAIASPQLLLQGGKRIIRLHIDNLTDLAGSLTVDSAKPVSPFQFYLTGEKGWLDAGKLMTKAQYDDLKEGLAIGLINPFVQLDEAAHYIDREGGFIFIYLPIASGAVSKFDAAVHTGYAIQTNQPVLRIMLQQGFTVSEDIYQKIKFGIIGLTVQVGSILRDDAPEGSGSALWKKIMDATGSDDFEKLLFLDGLRTMVLQNDDGLLAADKPFDPFTAYPFPGKSLYAGSEEVFNKPLGEIGGGLAINILKTSDQGEAFESWFQLDSASVSAGANDMNQYGAALLRGRSWVTLSPKFSKNGAFTQSSLKNNILYQLSKEKGSVVPVLHPRLPLSDTIKEWSRQTDKGFIRLTNLRQVNSSATMGTSQASQDMAASMQIKEVSVNYRSQLVALEASTDQFFHIYPFGAVETYINTPEELKGAGGKTGVTLKRKIRINKQDAFAAADKARDYLLVQAYNKLLPGFTYKSGYEDYKKEAAPKQIEGGSQTIAVRQGVFDYENIVAYGSGLRSLQPGNNQYSATLQEQGMLFIGIEKLEPLQSVSLLFQFADGSAEDEDQDPPEIRWSYLTNNEWRPLNGENLVSDSTYGFQTTGIIKIDVPEDATTNNTIITSGLIWFMASVEKDSNRIPMLIDVLTQAVEATFTDNDNDPTHFDQSLPAGSISKLSVKVAEVSKVTQPFASFDGKHKETGKEYYMRVSERLRHKGRAINAWDYEHLVLDRFPSIYKVKAINHTDPDCLCRKPQKTEVKRLQQEFETELKKTFLLNYNNDTNADEERRVSFKEAVSLLEKNPSYTISISLLGNIADPSGQEAFDKLGATVSNDWKKYSGKSTSGWGIESGNFGKVKLNVFGPKEKTTEAVSAATILSKFELDYEADGKLESASVLLLEEQLRKLKSNISGFPATVKVSAFIKPVFMVQMGAAVKEATLSTLKKQIEKAGVKKDDITDDTPGIGRSTIISVQFFAEKALGEVVIVEPAKEAAACCGPQVAPGHVLIIPIADLKNRNAVNRLQPKTGRRTLLEIEEYLKKRTSPFVKVHAKNPVYEQVMTAFRVKFYTGTDKGFYLKKLNEEIVEFLTPWAFDATKEVKFGAEVYASSIINFIEERPYVDFITDFFMFVCRDECCPPEEEQHENGGEKKETVAEILSSLCNCNDFEELLQSDFSGLVVARPSTSRSILVSVPQHIIVPYTAPAPLSDCEKRASMKKVTGSLPDIKDKVIDTDKLEKPVLPTPARPLSAADESATIKPAATTVRREKKNTPAAKKAVPVSKKKK